MPDAIHLPGRNLDHLDRNGNNDNMNDHDVEDAGPAAEVDIGINQHVEQKEDPLPGGSGQQSREEDDEDEESRSKRFRWWDELADSDCDSCFDSEDRNGDDLVTEEEEEDPLPGVSRKRERDEEDENKRSSKKSRQ